MFKEFISFWKNMFNFKGRTRRREYWVSYLWNSSIMLILIGITFCSLFACVDFNSGSFTPRPFPIALTVIFGIIFTVYYIAWLIGTVAISIRRCHDIGYKWYVFLFCILGTLLCGIGGIVWFVFSVFDSKEDNEWGPNPKNTENNEYTDSSGIIASIVAYIISTIIYIVLIFASSFGAILSSGTLTNLLL